MEFTDRKLENWSLQIERWRTEVWKLIFFKQIRKRNLILLFLILWISKDFKRLFSSVTLFLKV